MVKTCCALGCKNRFKKNGIGFFKFPSQPVRRKLWILAVKRKTFEPTNSSVVCGEHFQTGRPSKDPEHPDYVPNIFTFKPSKKVYQKLAEEENEKLIQEMRQEDNLHMDLKFEEHSENEMSVQEKELQQEYIEVCHLMHREDSSQKEELSSLKLELQEVYFTLYTVTEDRDQLVKDLSSANLTQNTLHNSLSENEEELSKLKKELQQAYTELNALRREKEELQKKLSATDITQNILQDPKKLYFYTGLSSQKDFRLILSLLSSVENNVKFISLETQTLIVLMKLKLNLTYQDLAHRFKCAITTVKKICVTLILILEAKLNMLVKSPINAALRKNIPVSFKNTVYENLYQRVQRNFKLRTKQEEESIDSNEM